MKLAIDTNAYSDFMRGDAKRIGQFNIADEINVPFIVLGELRAGFMGGVRGAANETVLQGFLKSERAMVLWPDETTTRHYASLHAFLKSQGTPIPENDLWIAALVLQHGLLLCTSDLHFQHLPQIAKC